MPETVSVQTGELMEQHWGDVDIQIATAKRYPRSIKTFIERATTMATITPEVAKSCFYALPRKEQGVQKMIKGPSARLAEIVASAWGHLRVEGRTVGEDTQFVTSRGVAWDLEANVAIAFEARRRITSRDGKRYNDDMIAVTANAATSIALRNAIFKTVPSSYWRPIYEQCLKVSVGDAKSLDARRKDAIAHFGALGVTVERVLATLEKRAIEDVDASDIETLIGLANAIKDSETTIEEAFPPPTIQTPQRKTAEPPAAQASTATTVAPTPEPASTAGQALHGEAAGQSFVAALDPTPPAAEPKPVATIVEGYSPTMVYHLMSVVQPKPTKEYFVFQTQEGQLFHAWSKTVIAGAQAALASALPVRFEAEKINFPANPWRVTKVTPIEEREPGEEG